MLLNRQYAEQIAREWNTRDERSGFAGYVLEFEVDTVYLPLTRDLFEVQGPAVGATQHSELWIEAAELPQFNQHIRGEIRVVGKFTKP